MSWKKDDTGGSSIEPLPMDDYPAVCVGIYDLGYQEREYKGKDTSCHTVLFQWMIPSQTIEYDDGVKPRQLVKEYPWKWASSPKKSNLRTDTEGWLGRLLEDHETPYDISKFFKKSCILDVGYTATGRNKVVKVKRPKEAVEVPEGVVPMLFSLDELQGPNLPDAIPEWIQAKIKASPTYREKLEPKLKEEAPAEPEIEDDDEIPF